MTYTIRDDRGNEIFSIENTNDLGKPVNPNQIISNVSKDFISYINKDKNLSRFKNEIIKSTKMKFDRFDKLNNDTDEILDENHLKLFKFFNYLSFKKLIAKNHDEKEISNLISKIYNILSIITDKYHNNRKSGFFTYSDEESFSILFLKRNNEIYY